MIFQPEIPFHLHERENNPESQKNRDDRYSHFTSKCRTVFEWLMSGKEITVLEAANNGVASLPRRLADLRDNGIKFSDRWENGIKVWWMSESDKEFNRANKKAA